MLFYAPVPILLPIGQLILAEEAPHLLVGVDQVGAAAQHVYEAVLNAARPDVARAGEFPQHDFGLPIAGNPGVAGHRNAIIGGSGLSAHGWGDLGLIGTAVELAPFG